MAEEVVEITETAEEVEAREAAAAKLADEEARKAELEANGGKKEPESEDDGLELEGIEVQKDGRVKFTWGNSVYISKEGLTGNKAIEDAYKQAREAEATKDKAFRELKTREKLRPVAKTDDAKATVGEPPNRVQFLTDSLRGAGVDPSMASWTDEQWNAYQDDKGLRDRQIVEIQTRIKDAVKAGDTRYQEENINWYNATVIDDSFENIVEILTEAGVDPDSFSDIYHSVLEKVTKEKVFQNQYGYIKSGQIEKEMTKEIMKVLKPKQEEAAKKEIDQKHIEAQRLKAKVKAPGSSQAQFKPKDKPIRTIAEARERAMQSIGKG